MHVFHQNFFYQVLLIMFRFLFSCYSHCFDILLACNISSMSHFASLPEYCQCYPREDVFPIFSLGSVREIHSLGKYFSVHSLGHSEYQEIHTFSALNIDSVKINTSLLMMREWGMLRNALLWTTGQQGRTLHMFRLFFFLTLKKFSSPFSHH